jgi:hypothetical protein
MKNFRTVMRVNRQFIDSFCGEEQQFQAEDALRHGALARGND